MNHLGVARLLFGLFLINEAVVMLRSTPEERRQIVLPRLMPLVAALLLAPFFFAVDLPPALGWMAVSMQAGGLLLEVTAEAQLALARSFSVAPRAPSELQRTGVYRYLENPIYLGIQLQVAGWGMWMPVSLLCVLLQHEALRRMVRAERATLAGLGAEHRGLDSFLWN